MATEKYVSAHTNHIKLPGYGSFPNYDGTKRSPVKTNIVRTAVVLECAAQILGGGMTGRLMHTVREQKGLGTYGIYAVMQYVSPQKRMVSSVSKAHLAPARLKKD